MNPERVIKAIRESFIGSEQVYTRGSCIMFYRILKTIYSEALPFWSKKASHCITKINNNYYDITGKVKKTSDYILDDVESYTSFPIATSFPIQKNNRWKPTTPCKTTEI